MNPPTHYMNLQTLLEGVHVVLKPHTLTPIEPIQPLEAPLQKRLKGTLNPFLKRVHVESLKGRP